MYEILFVAKILRRVSPLWVQYATPTEFSFSGFYLFFANLVLRSYGIKN